METFFAQLTAFLWSWPLPLALAGTNLMLTLRLRGIQRYGAYAVRLSLQASQAQKSISGFGALATSVGAAMGAGNILGMGVAVTVGFTGVTVAAGVGAGVTVMLAVPPTGCSSCSPVREENRNQPEIPMATRQRARTM